MTPWSAIVAVLEPFCPKGCGRGRPPIALERMLRMYVAQQCFGLSDEGIDDGIYDSQSIRHFVGIDLARDSAPDATMLLKFRRLLETHGLTKRSFETIIAAPSSTKNRDKARDPEMHQAKKGNEWHFGMRLT